MDNWRISADGTFFVLLSYRLIEAHIQGIKAKEPSCQGLTYPHEELQGLGRLDGAYDPRQNSKYPRLLATGNKPGRGCLLEKATIAWSLLRNYGSCIPLVSKDAAMREGFLLQNAGIIDEVVGGKVIASINYEVVASDYLPGVFSCQALL